MSDVTEIEFIKRKCQEALAQVTWANNICYNNNITIAVATELARQGLDGGKEAVWNLQPKTNDFHSWIDYAGLCTVLYNCGKTCKKFTILRKCCEILNNNFPPTECCLHSEEQYSVVLYI